jgi:hypothetical protein
MKLTATICLTFTILFGSVGMSAGADFQKGLNAYKSSDFATVLRESTPRVEKGYVGIPVQSWSVVIFWSNRINL